MDSCDAAFVMQFCTQSHLCHQQIIFMPSDVCKCAHGVPAAIVPYQMMTVPQETQRHRLGASPAVRGSLLYKGHQLLEIISPILQAAQEEHGVCCFLGFTTKLSSSKIIKVKWRLMKRVCGC